MQVENPIKLFEPTPNADIKQLPVDLIRSVAIYLVIFIHVTNTFYNQAVYQSGLSYQQWWTFVGYKSVSSVCVPLFVILTGALLLQLSKIDEPIGVFLKKRAKRLGYAFVFWTVIYLAWSFYITGTPFTFNNMLMGSVSSFLTGAYYQFWYIYLIVGLYLITPLLRAGAASKDGRLIGYLIKIWFISICLLPLLPLLTGYHLNGELFVMGGYSGTTS